MTTHQTLREVVEETEVEKSIGKPFFCNHCVKVCKYYHESNVLDKI